jgi:hypothetical protein
MNGGRARRIGRGFLAGLTGVGTDLRHATVDDVQTALEAMRARPRSGHRGGRGGFGLGRLVAFPCAIYCPAGERQYTVFIPMCILAGVRGDWTAHFAVVAIPFGVN